MKPLFPAFTANPGLVYLDSAASTLKPARVIDAVAEFSRTSYANVHRGLYPLSVAATEAYEGARATVAEFIGGKPQELIFTRNATEAVNLLAATLPQTWQAGDEILLSELEHHADLVPWQQAASRFGLILKFARITEAGEIDLTHFRSLVSPRTRLVALSHCSNVLGTVTPIAEIKKILVEEGSGALLFADASQSAPHFPVNAAGLSVDFLAFSGHKLYGPSGIGVLWGKEELLACLPPYQTGGDMVKAVSLESATWNDLPWKFEAGTPNIEGAMGLAEAVRFLREAPSVSTLSSYARVRLAEIPNLAVLGNPAPESGIISFVIGGVHPHDLADLLGQRGICIRAGHHCAMPLHAKLDLVASNRISFGAYNDEADVDAFIAATKDILADISHA